MNKRTISNELFSIDQTLYSAVKQIDILGVVTPVNYLQEKTIFFENGFKNTPNFVYANTQFSLLDKKRELFNLPIENLKNEDLYRLYFDVIQSYVDKLDQYRHLGTDKFLYDSMRYFGEPSDKDIKNAEFILHISNAELEAKQELLGADRIVDYFEHFADAHNLTYKIVICDDMVANALVSGDLIKVNKKANVTMRQLKALAHHELGVHLVTSLNAQNQPLKVLSLGSPVNTTAQEGLAILCEYHSGFMELMRLKNLALRVKAVKSLIEDRNFKITFSMLLEEYSLTQENAFNLTARVYRGGGYTKDFVYLRGFQQILTAYKTQKDFKNLLCGKVSLDHLSLVSRLVNKGYLVPPKFISPAIKRPSNVDPVIKFVAESIK